MVEVVARAQDPGRARMNIVRFAPCARTAWHSHPLGQTIYVTDGVGLIQARGAEVHVVRPGEVVWTPAGEEHWHGAAPDHCMTHAPSGRAT